MSITETSLEKSRSAPVTPTKSSTYKGPEFIQQINVRNAKLVALTLVIGFVAYHSIIHIVYGRDSCQWLLSDGRFQGHNVWQPFGCMMHTYSKSNSRMCMRYLAFLGQSCRITFIGDSLKRNLFFELANHIHTEDLTETAKHANLSVTDKDIRLTMEFIWHPYINESTTRLLEQIKASESRPSMVVMGSVMWALLLNKTQEQKLEEHRRSLTEVAKVMSLIAEKGTEVVWMLQDPVNEAKLSIERRTITNEMLDKHNRIALQVFSEYPPVKVWTSGRLVSQGLMGVGDSLVDDGLHPSDTVLKLDTQILLNLFCNRHMNYHDGTCCSPADRVTPLQITFLSGLGACLVIFFVVKIFERASIWHRSHARSRSLDQPLFPPSGNVSSVAPLSGIRQSNSFSLVGLLPSFLLKPTTLTLLNALGRMGLIMLYAFVCDRTTFFMKDNKSFTYVSFFLPVGYLFAVGVFFMEDSKHTTVLNRDLTDEWKGWMQLVILVYHLTGASRVVPIYMQLRVLVSSYLFMTGFGHFCYFWTKGDAGFSRFFQVLFRMNFLAVCLCFAMNRPYQFYYFVPLVSFWYAVLYVTLAIPPQITAASTEQNPLHYFYMVIKLVVLIALSTMLYMSEVFFERIFVTRPWKALFVSTDDDIHEWWFRWKLDRYSITFGMIFGYLYQLAQRYRLIDDSNHGNLWLRSVSLLVTLAGVAGLGGYLAFSFLCVTKERCNEVHSYLVFVPILSYVFLRNVSGYLRTRYSPFFVWFGKISLELFVMQYHIFLAADTSGILVLIPSYPVLNMLVVTFIFVCAAHEVHAITTILTPYAVPQDWRAMLRNIVVFICILIPIGIHDGMF